MRVLSAQAARLLPRPPVAGRDKPIQIDLVLGAAELWAFPFEACCAEGRPLFADPERPLILTRRIRQGFAAQRRAWPVRPRLLFLHAPEASDLSGELIGQHVAALADALRPWSSKGDPCGEGLLRVELALSPGDMKKALASARDVGEPFTHVHVLAHGKAIVDTITGQVRWGLRLGDPGRDASDPKDLAEALKPGDGLPVVVTVAACDSGNQASPAIPEKSFAQELHGVGVPIVLASQLPLTEPGSVTMTRTFYAPLLCGEDARWALHEARLALHADGDAGHDWVGLVGYVQLPEGYGNHLVEVGVKCEMELLKAARRRLDAVLDSREGLADVSERALDGIEDEANARIASLELRCSRVQEDRVALLSEARGILASAHKRLAELLFRRSQRSERAGDATAKRLRAEASKTSLQAALQTYRQAFRAHLQNHWLGTQQLALEAALHGRIAEGRDWDTTFHAAELALSASDAEYWAHGSIAELWLLAPLAGKPLYRGKAKEALDALARGARRAGDAYAVPATRDQLGRYFHWWTRENGFFGGREDLAEGARRLLQHLARDEKEG
jgi:hypothetical protein